jgi:glycosyltransferase involved in cell wall biosynthesis
MLMVRALGMGGTERQAAEVAKFLDRGKFAPHVACFHEGFRAVELRQAGVPILCLPVRSFLSLGAAAAAWRLGRYLRRERIRLVHTFDYPLNCFGAPVARAFRIPVVLSSQRADRALNPPAYRRLLRLTDRLVDGIVVNCEAVRRHLIVDENVPSSLIHVCPNGIDTTVFHTTTRARPPVLADASLVIGVVCVLRPEKGLDILLEAFAAVQHLDEGLRLVIVGSGESLEELQELSRKLGIADRCHFEPAVSDVVPWLRAIDIFVLPSLSEALSNSLMEAMACGCAVIASDTGGNPELVTDNETGLLFKTGDSAALADRLRTLISAPGLRTALAGAGAARMAAEFSIASSVARFERLYESLLHS